MDTRGLDRQLNEMINQGNSLEALHAFSAEFELDGMEAITITQVAVRRWQGEKVVRERFYHK